MQNNSPKPLNIALKVIILHTFGLLTMALGNLALMVSSKWAKARAEPKVAECRGLGFRG